METGLSPKEVGKSTREFAEKDADKLKKVLNAPQAIKAGNNHIRLNSEFYCVNTGELRPAG